MGKKKLDDYDINLIRLLYDEYLKAKKLDIPSKYIAKIANVSESSIRKAVSVGIVPKDWRNRKEVESLVRQKKLARSEMTKVSPARIAEKFDISLWILKKHLKHQAHGDAPV